MIWNDENVELLKKMYAQGAKCSDIASALNTTTRSVRNKAWKLGITHNDNYTEEEKEYIIANYKSYNLREISEHLGRPKTGICRFARQQGLDRTCKKKELTKSNPYSRTKSGKRSDLNGQFFRSAWEANIARLFNAMKIKWEYEPKTFYFEKIRRGCISYTPDFYLPEYDVWIEVKGWMDDKSRTKLKRFAKYYPNEKLELIDSKRYREIEKKAKTLPYWE